MAWNFEILSGNLRSFLCQGFRLSTQSVLEKLLQAIDETESQNDFVSSSIWNACLFVQYEEGTKAVVPCILFVWPNFGWNVLPMLYNCVLDSGPSALCCLPSFSLELLNGRRPVPWRVVVVSESLNLLAVLWFSKDVAILVVTHKCLEKLSEKVLFLSKEWLKLLLVSPSFLYILNNKWDVVVSLQ